MPLTATSRVATLHDLPGLYRVCRLTGAAGADASGQHTDPDLLGHVWVGAYAVAPGAVALVIQDDGGIAGYCVGTPDTAAFETWVTQQWLPPLQQRYPRELAAKGDTALVGRIHDWPHADPALLEAYPAHLHIDLLPRLQGQGWGRHLMTELASRLYAAGAGGLHLGVDPANQRAIAVYQRLGFARLHELPDAVVMGIGLGPAGLTTPPPVTP